MSGTVYVVHCIDTEGPLHETLEATFERLHQIFHLDLAPSKKTLKSLQAGKIDLGGMEKTVQEVVEPHLLDYNSTWDRVERMLEECLSDQFRKQYTDHQGNGWIYNWFCVDHVNYEMNPRHRDIGYHNIFDRYASALRQTESTNDGLHFHFHPHDFRHRAHACATHWWASSDSLHQVLCRRIIDRLWFPSCNRPGFQVNRPDSHWFLEQYLPFDYANLATAEQETATQFDFSGGRSGDWRRAPHNWQPYHPSHDDYQLPGECRRWIARCLNIGTRVYNITQADVFQAFEEARDGKPVILSFANHDFRDIRPDVGAAHRMLQEAAQRYPDVKYVHSEACEAMRRALDLPDQEFCDLALDITAVGDAHVLHVRTKTPSFGPQPFLALKTTVDTYLHDNFDMQAPFHHWTYTLDDETLPLRAVEAIGVGVGNACGKTSVAVMDTLTGKVKHAFHNGGSDLTG